MNKRLLLSRAGWTLALAGLVLGGWFARAQTGQPTGLELVQTMIAREESASRDTVHYAYLSEERSERTGEHLWTERMVETDWGVVRYLIAIDGKRLSAEQASAERARLTEETSSPEAYKRQESREEDAERSRQMLAVMPRAFLFEVLRADEREIHIAFHPAPAFTPQTMEERALHGMQGTVVLDAGTLRLRELEGRAPADVSLGFGLLATLRAGSAFSTSRQQVADATWRTSRVRTAIQGRALLLKTIARQQEYVHRDFQRLPRALPLREAVLLAER